MGIFDETCGYCTEGAVGQVHLKSGHYVPVCAEHRHQWALQVDSDLNEHVHVLRYLEWRRSVGLPRIPETSALELVREGREHGYCFDEWESPDGESTERVRMPQGHAQTP